MCSTKSSALARDHRLSILPRKLARWPLGSGQILHLPARLSRPLCTFPPSCHPKSLLQVQLFAEKILPELAPRAVVERVAEEEMEVEMEVEMEGEMEEEVHRPTIRRYLAANARTPLAIPHFRCRVHPARHSRAAAPPSPQTSRTRRLQHSAESSRRMHSRSTRLDPVPSHPMCT